MPAERRAAARGGRGKREARRATGASAVAPAAEEAAERRRVRTVLMRLKRAYPEAECSLDFADPWQLLVAVILSAQCTDERVNLVTPRLFARWRGPAELARAPQREIEEVIHSTGFYRAKARHIKATAQQVMQAHGGRVPRTLDELVALPGVARKTANVVLHVAYGGADPAAGIAVDTHVTRLSNRLALVATGDPGKIERRLMELVARRDWGAVTHLFIAHGRAVCIARSPRCRECGLADRCPSAAVFED